MTTKKLYFGLVLSAVLFLLSVIKVNADKTDISPTTHKADIIAETVTYNGEEVETLGYIAKTDENGKETILSIVNPSDVTISTDIENNTTLKKIYDEILEVKSLSSFNSKLDSIAQSLNKNFNASVFVVTDLFELTLSDSLKEALNSSEDNYYSVKLNLDTTSQYKPVVMHQNEETSKWIIVDSENVIVENGNVTVKFNDLCPVMVLTVNEENTEKEVNVIPYIIIIFLSVISAFVLIYLIATIARKKKIKK